MQDAPGQLSVDRFKEMTSAAGGGLYVAGRYPTPCWEQVVGFVPDNEYHYEVVVGSAVNPGEQANVFARALISRDGEEDFCFIQWNPSANDA